MRCYIPWVAMYTPAYTKLWTTPSYCFYAFINIWHLLYNGQQCIGRYFCQWWIVRVSAQALCCLQGIFTYRQYKSCVRERQLESVEAFSLCCYMQTCFHSSVLSPVVGSAVAKSVWLVFRRFWVRIPFFLSPKLVSIIDIIRHMSYIYASIFSIYCHTADELCGSDRQAPSSGFEKAQGLC